MRLTRDNPADRLGRALRRSSDGPSLALGGGLGGGATPMAASLGDLFLWLGQSNAMGQDTDLSALPSPWPPTDTTDRIRIWDPVGGVWETCTEPAIQGGGSPATPFLDYYARGDAEVLSARIVWSAWTSHIEDWEPGDALYDDGIARAEAAIAEGYTLRAVFFYQGEQNALPGEVGSYEANLTALIANLRADLPTPPGLATLPIILVGLHPRMGAGRTDWPHVKRAQLAVAEADSTLLYFEAFGDYIGDLLHLTTQASYDVGRYAAARYLSRHGRATPGTALTTIAGDPLTTIAGDPLSTI